MQKDPPPPEFDWVTERAKCSPERVFEQLSLQAQQNVKTRNEQIADYAVFEQAGNKFKIWNAKIPLPDRSRRAADFELRGERIVIMHPGGRLEVSLTLDDNGVCKCLAGAEALDPWQVLRRALEAVLFPVL